MICCYCWLVYVGRRYKENIDYVRKLCSFDRICFNYLYKNEINTNFSEIIEVLFRIIFESMVLPFKMKISLEIVFTHEFCPTLIFWTISFVEFVAYITVNAWKRDPLTSWSFLLISLIISKLQIQESISN